MMSRVALLASITLLTLGSVSIATPAAALTMKECSAKYKAAQGSGNTMKWNDFRKAECGPDATAEPDVTLNANDNSEPEKPTMKAPTGVQFPSKVSTKYSSETPGKARMHTCVDAYHQNKDANTLNGLKWIQKGGGFYSLCNAKLKG
ncbi:hypothetical protein J2Y48_002093 [Mycoplana sp. BE70]|uniref:hypothetical protein n=1 Tax=Mycoplana sp. BE70 TaxID=2817775 RepID=UPI00285F58AD|nr:hypothetical protein [Mycoplana sp. BE70]MDR6756800.1 hypothetical protein [Mycoplana sp. BE70]